MREKKFRAWDAIRKKWVAEFPTVAVRRNDDVTTWQYMTGGALQVMQYTGLTQVCFGCQKVRSSIKR